MNDDTFDVVVGIPSYNEAPTIGYVTRVAGEGLAKYFPDAKSVIVNCDNNSMDGTKDAFLSASIPNAIGKRYISTPEGVTGKGNNFYNLFQFCRDAESKVMIVVDADLRSITPDWIKYLGYPIKRGQDFVTPLYSRHQFDGTITNHLCYPLAFSLAGVDVRQPIGGDFAFSSRLCSHWLNQEWNDMTKQYGIDIFMSLTAFFDDFKICQSGLGNKVHNASSPKLGKMFEEVVYTLFSLLLRHRKAWLDVSLKGFTYPYREARPVFRYGLKKLMEPQALSLDVLELKEQCRNAYGTYQHLIKQYLSSYANNRIRSMFAIDHYDLDIMLWTQIVYRLLFVFEGASEKEKKEIIDALKPLYFARSLSFDYTTFRYSVEFAEQEVRNQSRAFLSQKPYLLGLYLLRGHMSKAVQG
ncbi:MAG: glycosyltransferase family 2 protein [Syntrophales bacterium]|nr:glycosyltransferase family 2 protein [Syntrophales bacterium]